MRARALCFTCLVLASGCGYRAVYAEGAAEPLCVAAAPPKVPDFDAVQAALDAARAELGRAGALASNGSYPCLMIEVLRVEEAATGIALDDLGARERPRARGLAIAVSGRGFIQAERGAPASRDTGDLRRSVRLEAVPALQTDAARDHRAVQAAAALLGQDIARRVLGLPTPTDDAW